MPCTVFSSYIFGARLFESRLTLPQGLQKVNRGISFYLLVHALYSLRLFKLKTEKQMIYTDDLRTSYFTVFAANGKIQQQLSFFSVRRSFKTNIYCNDSNAY